MAGYTTGVANPNLQQLANTPAEYSGDMQDLVRSQRLAQMLTSSPVPEGQMVSGRFVAPSWTQNLNQLVNAGLGAYYSSEAEEKQTKLANKLREDKLGTQQGIMDAINKGDTKAALAIASSRPEYAKEFIAPLMANVIPKAASPTTEMQNYTFAKTPEGGGFKGSFGDYQKQQANLKDIQSSYSPIESNGQMFAMNSKTGQLMPLKDPSGQALPAKLTAEQNKDILAINQQRATIDGAIADVNKNKSAFSFGRGVAQNVPYGESIAGRFEKPEDTQARAYVFNNVSSVIKERAGTAQSAQELQRLNSFLPATTDNADQIVSKLKGFNQYLKDLESGTRVPTSKTSTPSSTNSFSSDADLQKAISSGTLKRGDKVTVNGVTGTIQ